MTYPTPHPLFPQSQNQIPLHQINVKKLPLSFFKGVLVYFIFEILIQSHFPHPFLPSNCPIHPSPISFKFMTYFSINSYCMFICTHMEVSQYTLLSLYNVIFCMFSELIIWNWKTNLFSLPSLIQLPTVLCAELRSHGLFPIKFSMFIHIFLCATHVGGFYRCNITDMTRRHNLLANSLILQLYKLSSTSYL